MVTKSTALAPSGVAATPADRQEGTRRRSSPRLSAEVIRSASVLAVPQLTLGDQLRHAGSSSDQRAPLGPPADDPGRPSDLPKPVLQNSMRASPSFAGGKNSDKRHCSSTSRCFPECVECYDSDPADLRSHSYAVMTLGLGYRLRSGGQHDGPSGRKARHPARVRKPHATPRVDGCRAEARERERVLDREH